MNPREHIAASLNFLELADISIAERNPLLRSELLWCAAAHTVKAVSKQTNLRNRSHEDLFTAIRHIAHNLGETDLIARFNLASLLHRNMYEGDLSNRAIIQYRQQVRQLVHRLAALVG